MDSVDSRTLLNTVISYSTLQRPGKDTINYISKLRALRFSSEK